MSEQLPILIYQDAEKAVDVRLDEGQETVWLTQRQMSEVFDVKPQNITIHLKNIYAEEELVEEGTCKEFLQVQIEGGRKVKRARLHYNLDAIISVGYRVNSRRAVRFRQWATRVLRDHLAQGWTLHQQRFEANARELEAAMAGVDRSIWTDRMLAALDNGVKGRKWFSLIDKVHRSSTLASAWLQVYRNQGAAGVDRQSVSRFAAQSGRHLEELQADLAAGRYRPQAVRRIEIPKGDGKTRPLAIPTVKDRIVQAAVKRVIEPILEHEFLPMSYGFRPGRGCKDALRAVDDGLKAGMTWGVDADLQGYFDSIPHDRLMSRVEERLSDGRLLSLLRAWLTQDIVSEMNCWSPTAGAPQGAIISPLLANLYLHPLDQEMTQRGYRMVRYADDFVILCYSEQEARQALAHVQDWVMTNGLTLHPDKPHIGDCRQRGEGFDFLGYRFEAGKRWVRRKSLRAFKDKVRSKTRRTEGKSLRQIIASLNPLLRGWFGYLRHAYRTTFRPLDGFIRRRLRAILRKQEKRPGRGNTGTDTRRWPNRFFAAAGLFTLAEAWQQASQSRC